MTFDEANNLYIDDIQGKAQYFFVYKYSDYGINNTCLPICNSCKRSNECEWYKDFWGLDIDSSSDGHINKIKYAAACNYYE